tara:strand:- start:177 stop:629 length:453 start_codon:yes stop_codon:yes gene_type:complete
MEIEGYENYLIYDDGRVQNKKTKRFLKQRLDKDGYYKVILCKNGKSKTYRVHRLVGLHYLESVEGKNIIDHIDRNKSNNYVSNLRWVNNAENQHNTDVRKNNKLGLKYICKNTHCSTYKFTINRNNIIHSKHFKTLDECINYRDEYLANN